MSEDFGRKKRQNNGKETLRKTDIRYWETRVFKAQDRAAGGVVVYEADTFSVKFQHRGKRHAMSLHTANLREAAGLAREQYLFLVSHGWQAFWAKYRPSEEPAHGGVEGSSKAVPEPKTNVTVGEYLEAVARHTALSPALVETYAKPFRLLVSEIARVRASKKRFDYRSGGHAEWLKAVSAVPLALITPESVLAWKKQRIKEAGSDKLKERTATISTNSTIRQARALFSRRNVIPKLAGVLELPGQLPFDGIAVERASSKFYGCGIGAHELLNQALAELGTEELKAFLLALAFGLRKREADWLEWSAFDFSAGMLSIQPTQWYDLKTPESAASLPVEPEILALFRAWKAKAKGRFVIESALAPKAVGYQWYRCQPVFEFLLDWLRSKGVVGNKPLHQLRKLYGSALSDLHGIHVASLGLRHSDIRTTSEHYADSRLKLSPGFGAGISAAASGTVAAFPDSAIPEVRKGRKRRGPS
jgi:integrase